MPPSARHVLRVEREETGEGPYSWVPDPDGGPWWRGESERMKAFRLAPYEETKKFQDGWYSRDQKSLYFGFSSRRQLVAWFPKEDREKLRHRGFVVSEYRVSTTCVICGKRQVAFVKEGATLVRIFTLDQEADAWDVIKERRKRSK